MSTVILQGPLPSEGADFCTMCAMYWKAIVISEIGDEIAALEGNGKDDHVVIDLERRAPRGLRDPREAVTVALVNGNPQLGMAKVCWTHMMNVTISKAPGGSGLAQATADVDTLAGMGLIPAAKGQRQ